MKTIPVIIALLTLTAGNLRAEDKKPESSKETLSTGPAPEKPMKLTLQSEALNEIITPKVTLKGPLVALVKSDRPLQTVNPFVPSTNAWAAEDFKSDPYVGRPRGIVLFSLGF